MLNADSLKFLHRLLDTPGPSGFESAPAKIWREEAARFAKVRGDVAGNSIAEVNTEGAPTIMLAGHIDEIGVIVTYIDDEGFAYIASIGGGIRRSSLRSESASSGGTAMSSASLERSRYIR